MSFKIILHIYIDLLLFRLLPIANSSILRRLFARLRWGETMAAMTIENHTAGAGGRRQWGRKPAAGDCGRPRTREKRDPTSARDRQGTGAGSGSAGEHSSSGGRDQRERAGSGRDRGW